jgi:multiple sugar transport system substrate-binding protein
MVMCSRNVILAAALILVMPLGVRAADLVVWWDEGFYAEEAEAVRETVAAFEQRTGKQVELVFHPEGEHPEAIVAALEAGQPPDFAFGFRVDTRISEWAFNDRLVDLSGAVVA